MVRILALDTARRTGWCTDGERDDAGPPLHGVWKLPGLLPATIDKAASALFDLVQAAIRQHRAEVLVVEEINQGTVSRPGMGLGHRTLPSIACLAAFRLGVRRFEVNTSTMRKNFVGHGRPKDPKVAMLAACARLGEGWRTKDHNEADAMGIWCLAKARLQPDWQLQKAVILRARVMAAPLFAQGETS